MHIQTHRHNADNYSHRYSRYTDSRTLMPAYNHTHKHTHTHTHRHTHTHTHTCTDWHWMGGDNSMDAALINWARHGEVGLETTWQFPAPSPLTPSILHTHTHAHTHTHTHTYTHTIQVNTDTVMSPAATHVTHYPGEHTHTHKHTHTHNKTSQQKHTT